MLRRDIFIEGFTTDRLLLFADAIRAQWPSQSKLQLLLHSFNYCPIDEHTEQQGAFEPTGNILRLRVQAPAANPMD
jgi:hypothetical protein